MSHQASGAASLQVWLDDSSGLQTNTGAVLCYVLCMHAASMAEAMWYAREVGLPIGGSMAFSLAMDRA